MKEMDLFIIIFLSISCLLVSFCDLADAEKGKSGFGVKKHWMEDRLPKIWTVQRQEGHKDTLLTGFDIFLKQFYLRSVFRLNSFPPFWTDQDGQTVLS